MTQRLKANAARGIWFLCRLCRPFGLWIRPFGLWKVCGGSAFLALLLAACAALSDNTVQRSLGWFNFLNGTDIKQGCAPGAGDRYRLVYNAIWGEQVRVYEIIAPPPGFGPAILTTRVMFPENLNQIDLRDPLQLFRGKGGTVALSPAEMAELRQRLRQSGYYDAAPEGLTLPSDGFYWVVSSCEDGLTHFNAYLWPSPRFDAIAFADWLFMRDPSGVAVAPPRPSAPRVQNRVAIENRAYSVFDLRVGTYGFWPL